MIEIDHVSKLFGTNGDRTVAVDDLTLSVDQGEAVKKLHDFAESNKETTGKFTIGDEKVRVTTPHPSHLISHHGTRVRLRRQRLT